MVKAIQHFLEFCYLVRCESISEDDLSRVHDEMTLFHQEREIFREEDVWPDGFSLPHQHSMSHYPDFIAEFGAPNGLCSSITESKHIKAVKQPWRRSNRYKALGQMLLTNERLDKLAASRVHFQAHGLLSGSILPNLNMMEPMGDDDTADDAAAEDDDGGEVDGRIGIDVNAEVVLACKPGKTQ